MPERGGVQKTMIAAGLIVVGGVLAWTAVALALGTAIGVVVRRADQLEGGGEPVDIETVADLEAIWADQDARPQTLLGVVHPGLPSSLEHPEHRLS